MADCGPTPGKPGRPLGLDAAMIARAADLAGKGVYAAGIAAALGVHEKTLQRWVTLGRKVARALEADPSSPEPTGKDALYLLLVRELKKARAGLEQRLLERIEAAASKHWQAAAWLLERRNPERWGAQKQEIREMRRQLDELLKRHANT